MAAPFRLTDAHIRSIFSLLTQPATDAFFTHMRDDVAFTVTGQSFLSGHWDSKASYRAATFEKLGALIAAPGIKLRIAEGAAGVIVGQGGEGGGGWAAVDLETVDTFTKGGVRYEQRYVWLVRFDEMGLMKEVRTWLDTLTLERVLGAERKRQGLDGE
ncbi:MAG: hypothetical protein LQ339_006452 [Xanthoria mediterranea]|nr:MAG: hypothetical protein LQ339_006452 [Xanthoria mediterranea]